jgi:undecaprenyl-phosphate 4-deoxy-4-formamido-L-arabinose transferase
VYGRYRVKHHSAFRNLGSWLNDRLANLMLRKPRELYLSSFKLMNRFVVDEIVKYRGAFPYIDGLILRTTHRLGQIDVEHRPAERPSGYNLRRLFLLWLNMLLNFSIAPLRLSALLGVTMFFVSLALMVVVVLDKLYLDPELPLGIPTLLILVVFFAGLQLVILGTIGEYLGRLFLDHSQSPQYVVRYVEGEHAAPAARPPVDPDDR